MGQAERTLEESTAGKPEILADRVPERHGAAVPSFYTEDIRSACRRHALFYAVKQERKKT